MIYCSSFIVSYPLSLLIGHVFNFSNCIVTNIHCISPSSTIIVLSRSNSNHNEFLLGIFGLWSPKVHWNRFMKKFILTTKEKRSMYFTTNLEWSYIINPQGSSLQIWNKMFEKFKKLSFKKCCKCEQIKNQKIPMKLKPLLSKCRLLQFIYHNQTLISSISISLKNLNLFFLYRNIVL